jgi:putative membrane protein
VPLVAGLCVLGALVLGFYLAQRGGLFGRAVRVFEGLVGIGAPTGSAYARALDRAVRRLYMRRRHVRRSIALHFLAWLGGALQVYAAAAFLGRSIDWLDALILEGLITAVRAAAFMIPGALGVQEGGFILLGGLVGLPPEAALALSLIRRVRELLLGVPGIVLWQRRAILRGTAALLHCRSAR